MPRLRIFTLALVLVVSLGRLSGQTTDPDEKGYQDANVLRQKSVLLRTGDDVMLSAYDQSPQFPNVNILPYFYDKKIIASIKKLESKGDVEELDKILLPYVEQFGVTNFQQDLPLIWLAGRVKHILGDTARAVYFYELAQIHNRGLAIPKLTYDSLVSETNTEWLPIDKYYELLEVRKRIDPMIKSKKVLQNMGPRINSDDPDYAPSMHPSDSVLIFTSRRDTSGMKSSEFIDPFHSVNEDLYFAEIDFMTGQWKESRRLSDTINSQFNEGSACLAADGKTLFFTRCRTGRGFGDCDIYSAIYDPTTDSWINVQNLGKNINSDSWDSQPNLSLDGQTLFFSSNRKGGFGGTDLYYSTLNEKGKWSEAKNIGPLINTPQNEVTPFFHKINQTLYFSSTGHLKNFGGYDIFKSRWIGDRWESPDNVGPLVNTMGNEYYFSIDGKGETIFYANSKDPEKDHVKQNFDLYSFPMPMEARPDAIAALRGFLVDSVSGYTLQGTVMIIDLEDSIEVAPKKINEYGYFEFDLINNKRYRIYVLGDNFLTVKKDILVTGDTTFQVLTQSFEENKPIVFEALNFGSNSTKLKATVKPHLDYVVRFLKNYPMFKLEVEGHTDSDGRAESNLSLSQKRAESIATYIIEQGEFNPDRVTSRGYGETRPIVPNDTEENKEKNRRVEFKLTLDKSYEGDLWLPTSDELFIDEELDLIDDEFDPNEEFEWSEEERKSWEEELDVDPDLDLEAELEDDILRLLKDDDNEEVKKDPVKKGKDGGSRD
ncbi:MAG: OmpA family protein [Bacteroidetes bacterium]|nr:OmpA family protein [Bacteroidota bacterium]